MTANENICELVPQKLIIRRHPSFKRKLQLSVSRFTHTHFRTICATVLLASILAISLVVPHEKAKGSVEEISSPDDLMLYDSAAGTTVKPIEQKKLGDYTMTVDLHYLRRYGKPSHIGAPYGALVGIKSNPIHPAFIPDSLQVNWAKTLDHLWQVKLAKTNVTPATVKWASHITQKYAHQPRDTKSISAFIHEVDKIAVTTHHQIDYPSLCDALHINQCQMYKDTMSRVRGENLVAYSLSEVMPSHDGAENYIMMDTLLRNAGENYVDAIPSLGDPLLSTGFFQFTSYAIRRDNSGSLGGVTFIDNFAGRHLSGSVAHLRPHEAQKAAFEFAAYNMANIMRGMNQTDANRLAHVCMMTGLTDIIATSHHMPVPAWAAAKNGFIRGAKILFSIILAHNFANMP